MADFCEKLNYYTVGHGVKPLYSMLVVPEVLQIQHVSCHCIIE